MTNNKKSAPTRSREVAECVSGVLFDGQSVLVEKRRADDDADPGFTLLPGGHVEPGESLEDALVREMKEELGIRVTDMKPVRIVYHTSSDGEIQRVHYFQVKDWTGEIRSREAERVYWESRLGNLGNPTERKIVSGLLKQNLRKR